MSAGWDDTELEVLGEGEGWQSDRPCVIIDAEFARKALDAGELPLFVHQALEAMELSGQRVAVLREAEA